MTPAPAGASSREALFSVLVLTHRRPELLRSCLRSLQAADLRLVREIVVAVNGEDMEDVDMARSFSALIPCLEIILLERQSRGAARNAALARTRGEWIYFLDDDVEAPPGLFAEAASLIAKHGDAWVLGGPNLTPPGSGLFERASGLVLESWIGAGPMRRRYAPGPRMLRADEKSFALCNLCARAAAFRELGLRFDPHLASAEENLFVLNLRALGRRALYAPVLAVYHRRRAELGKFLSQVYESGVGRRQITRKLPRAAQAVFFFPAVLVLYAVFLAAARPAWPFWIAPALYALAAAGAAARGAWKSKNPAAGLLFFALVPLCHLAYGTGFLAGRPLPKSFIK
ncbi:MAG TPA: glycosyltransferase [Elusimicrobiota bacterium]|nr:glycosyltransferase [Elusimicrobiota bacterium]